MATATPYRADGQEVLPPGIKVLHRTLVRHMLEHDAPSHFETSIVTIPKRGAKLTTAQFLGDETPDLDYVKTIVANFVQTWEEDGRPKTIVRVPPEPRWSESPHQVAHGCFQKGWSTGVECDGDQTGR